MLNKSLVDGFNVDKTTSKLDCQACIESKGSEEPFQKQSERKTVPGKLTHIDLWGKYSVVSINRHQHYIIFVDDAGWYVTINFLKEKNQASQKVKEYLTYLKTQGKNPKAIHVDGEKEFINQDLHN